MHIILFFIGLLISLGNLIAFPLEVFIGFCFLSFSTFLLKFSLFSFLTIVLFLILGYLWGEFNLHLRIQERLPKTLENRIILVEGRIISVPVVAKSYQQFQFFVEQVKDRSELPWRGRVALSWYKTNKMRSLPLLRVGEKWSLAVKLKRPRGYSNPGSFDYEAWLFEQHIMAKGYVISNKDNHQLEAAGWHAWVNQIRQKIERMWQPYLERYPFIATILAITVGLTGAITPEQWQIFTNTGTIHLISISGFHVSFMAGLAYAVINFLWRRSTFLIQRWPAQRVAALGGLFTGAIYSTLAGLAIPTQRALVTLCIVMGGILFRRYADVGSCFLISLLCVVLLDPFAPLNLSFWLTYGSVGVILYAILEPASQSKGYFARLVQALKLQGAIFVGLIPFSLFWFAQVPLSSLWANALAIPITGFIVLPLALVSMIVSAFYLPLAIFLMKIAHWFFAVLYSYLCWISKHCAYYGILAISHIPQFILGVLGILIILAPKGFPGRWLGGVLWLPIIFPLQTEVGYGEAQFSLLDVGQGLACVVETAHHTLVFDTGPKFNDYFDTGKAVVLPYLRNQHRDKIDVLVISHEDMDHRGGMLSIVNGMPVDKIYVNRKAAFKDFPTRLCRADIQWEWDGVQFHFLTRGLENFTNRNDTSCVLKVSNAFQSLLLPGDLEEKGEKALMLAYGQQLKTDLLVAGHHGSKTSSSTKWVETTAPHYVLMPTGYLNRYHFPHPEVVLRYMRHGSIVLSTSACGMISWRLPNTKEVAEPGCYRQQYAHPWYTS